MKYLSVVLQPKLESSFWLSDPSFKEMEEKFMMSAFPLANELIYLFKTLKVLTINKKTEIGVEKFVFGTETSKETKIPHYQIYLEFSGLIRSPQLRSSLEKILGDRAHISVKKVYNQDYQDYCKKLTSNLEYDCEYFWNVKYSSDLVELSTATNLLNLRDELKMVKENYLTGQKLIKRIAFSKPDGRSGIWICDIIGGTGKSAFFQTLMDDPAGLYVGVSEGVDRLSANIRRKITARLKKNLGYPKFVWLNFGRTVSENVLKTFSNLVEQLLDGMLDDNFGNTGGDDFLGLPYLNVFVTANTPPNLNQLTGDRLKLLALFPIYETVLASGMKKPKLVLKDSLLIPISVEIQVRLLKSFPSYFQYRFKIDLQDSTSVYLLFSEKSYYSELLENIRLYREFLKTPSSWYVKSKLISKWVGASPNNVQQDVLNVYTKALFCAGSLSWEKRESLIESSSRDEIASNVSHYVLGKQEMSTAKTQLDDIDERASDFFGFFDSRLSTPEEEDFKAYLELLNSLEEGSVTKNG